MSGFHQEIITLLAINVVAAYGAYLPMAAGQINLGIAGFMAIGGYISAYISNTYGLPAYVTVFIGAAGSGLVALAVAIPVLRTRGIYLALITFGLGQLVVATILNLDAVGGASGYPVRDYIGNVAAEGLAAASVVVVLLLMHTRFGLTLTAIHDDEAVASIFGVNVRKIQVGAFTFGAVLAGLAGGIYAHHFSVIEVQHFDVFLSIYIVLFVLLGGVHSIVGPLLGAAVFALLPELLRGIDRWRYVVFSALIILLMMFRPHGLLGTRTQPFALGRLRPRSSRSVP